MRRSRIRPGVGVGVALATVVASATVAGSGLAASLAKPGGGQGATKVELCHKQKVTIRVSTSAKPAHEAHGDTIGACAAPTRTVEKPKPGSKAEKAARKAEKALRKAERQRAKKAKQAGKAQGAAT